MAELTEKDDPVTSSILHFVQEVFLVFVIAAAIVLNFSVVYVICRNKHLRKITTNIFILNLVVSNALMAIFVMPLSLVTFKRLGWTIDSSLCKVRGIFLNFNQLFSFFANKILNNGIPSRKKKHVFHYFSSLRNWENFVNVPVMPSQL